MKLTFRIKYRTVWGENLRVVINDEDKNSLPLFTRDGNEWQGTFDYDLPESSDIIPYRYTVFRNEESVRKEFGAIPHSIIKGNAQQHHLILDDCWRDLPHGNHRYSSALNGITHTEEPQMPENNAGGCITFRALCPGLRYKAQELGITGNCDKLGNWECHRPLRMQEILPGVWHLTIDTASLPLPFEYKFVAINSKTGNIEEWERGYNRTLHIQPLRCGETYFPMETEVFFNPSERKIAGSAIPVFSLRSEGSFGVGDFGDLKTYIDWAAETNQQAVQILPINDTTRTNTWVDSYPYNAISIYAFHPMYIDVRQLPKLKNARKAGRYEKERRKLNSLPQVDYERVNNAKRSYLRDVFAQEAGNVLSSEDFRSFYIRNEEWLKPYSAFSYLRDLYGTANFNAWPEHSTYIPEETDKLCDPKSDAYREISFYYFLQYVLHVQLLSVADHARGKSVILKGDIPIGISRGSVEAWTEPYYFNMNGQAGAPPDAFSTNGQNWGFPTYNWDVMEKDNYQWWRNRFAKMAEYFTAYRIDHILGFFRIWEIPAHSVHGLLGQFAPALPMTADEIKGFGLNFRKEFMTEPFVNGYMLDTIFGGKRREVCRIFVEHVHNDIYRMRPEFDTQRKVEAYFDGKSDKESLDMKEGIYSLISNVLFVKDRKNPETYHPRISVQNDFIYRQLDRQEQEAFDRLYYHYYYQRHNIFWYDEAMKKLPVLTQSTSMLVCGEDLGMVPECVPWVMDRLQILSLEIQRMPKDPKDEFGHVGNYPLRSVCTIGTHDMSTLRGYWKENPQVTERYYHHELGHWGEVPQDAPGWLCREVVNLHLTSPSLLCILTWQDWTSIDENLRNPDTETERINIPANPRNYWRWRMHVTLEDLMKNDGFNKQIRKMISESGRA